MKLIKIADVKRHIKMCKKKHVRFNWLGFVENKDLSDEVEALFAHPTIPGYYDWVNGNKRLQKLEKEVE